LQNPKQEAELIVNALFEDYGTGGLTRGECPGVDGKDAIQEMKADDFPGWQEVEWAGYHIKYLVQKTCEEKLTGQILPYDQGKRHLVKGSYVWDARFNSHDQIDVILGDVEEYTEIIKKNGGIGVLVVDAAATPDTYENFRRWQEEQKGKVSEYSIRRELEGRPARERKAAYMIRKIFAYFFTLDKLQEGVRNGWADDIFQQGMRNAGGSSRKPKYRLKTNLIPSEYLLLIKNFNEDPEEFEKDFPDSN
jgi:hypothetical protein